MKNISEYYKKFPWRKTLVVIKQRCENPNNISYPWYGNKGIKCNITENEIKKLWFRDKAYLMKKPSIDRKDSNKDYTYNNCRFIELVENVIKCNKLTHKKSILQFDLDGNFIREWDSAKTASLILSLFSGNITKCCKQKVKTCGGFIWKYK